MTSNGHQATGATIFTTGPDDGFPAQISIESGYAVAEAFTLTSNVMLNQVKFDDCVARAALPCQ